MVYTVTLAVFTVVNPQVQNSALPLFLLALAKGMEIEE
jgi:hypothetical protein